jgi:hypothetical protein
MNLAIEPMVPSRGFLRCFAATRACGKSEARNPRSERDPTSEIRNTSIGRGGIPLNERAPVSSGFGSRASFGSRVSGFGFNFPRAFAFHFALLAGLSAAASFAADAPKLTSAQTEFFETKVRPVLVENCYKCHSSGAEKIKGGLVLDTREGWLKGGDSGPVIVPGKPDESLFVKAVRYTARDLAMPPNDKKLPDNLIADLVQWVRMGAPDPRTEAVSAKAMYAADLEKAKKHWAYRPVVKPEVPAVANSQSPMGNPIDAFIGAKLLQKGLTPAAKADKVTLLRRATFDLHGLPPK